METFQVATSDNGLPIFKKDTVIIIGEEPKHPVVCYTTEMKLILNDKNQYTVNNIHLHDNGKFSINIAGWNWDCRIITKVIKNTDGTKDYKPEMFNPKNLDI